MKKGQPLRPDQGPKRKLTRENEKVFVEFLQECWEFGMPKEKKVFADEIVHFMICYDIKNTFPNIVPGTVFMSLEFVSIQHFNLNFSLDFYFVNVRDDIFFF